MTALAQFDCNRRDKTLDQLCEAFNRDKTELQKDPFDPNLFLRIDAIYKYMLDHSASVGVSQAAHCYQIIQSSSDAQWATFMEMCQKYVTIGDYSSALGLAEKATTDDEKDQMLQFIEGTCCKNGNFHQGIEAAKRLVSKQAQRFSFGNIVNQLVIKKNYQILEQCMGDLPDGIDLDLSIAADTLAKQGALNLAIQLTESIKDQATKDSTLASFVHTLVDQEKPDEARDIIQKISSVSYKNMAQLALSSLQK